MKMIVCMLFFSLASMTTVPASATTISIDNVFMKPGEDAVTPIMINNVSNLGVADINLTFDPSVVHVLSATSSDFDFFHAVIDNSTGVVRMGGIDYGDGLNGDIKLAEITLKAVGNHGEATTLGAKINELKEAGAIETSIPATEDNGTAFINIPPVAIAIPMHSYNIVGNIYVCKAVFNGSNSYDPDGDAITNYSWDFGDGYSDEGRMTEHIYSTYNYNGTGYEPFNLSLTVTDSGGLTNTTITQINVFIAGDANGDGVVDIFDGVMVGLEWGKKCTDSSWTAAQSDKADLNNDCVIDIFDGVIVGANWEEVAW
ncbi:MAG: PKD domain-containing protein [Methanophagales archaeon]|nr:PKD domain-containing protein [Methanophagales archaeon]MCW3137675.1 PKD domain-containing protein [Methanophagales archaeon]MCW7069910.1 PKD domain-containing protein [Methanophagales archaeon]MCW7072561.1 PKD domain-containing protein [Methanophagales archaeon]